MRHKTLKPLFLSLGIGLLMGLFALVALAYTQDTITPDVTDWPQKYNNETDGSWCSVAALQAKIDWDWNDHRHDPNHFHSQAELWNYARDHTCSDIAAKGVQGHDTALPGTVGNGWYEVRKLNIAYDFGLDPHAVAWMLWKYGPDYYHYWIYDNAEQATWALLYTVEFYHEPAMATVSHGTHWVLVIGYEADVKATAQTGMTTVYRVRYADPLLGPGSDLAYVWVPYDAGAYTWIDYFTIYTDTADPDPSTGWYVPPPDHWQNHWVTVERDTYTSHSPDWAMGPSGPITPHWPYQDYLPIVLKNCW